MGSGWSNTSAPKTAPSGTSYENEAAKAAMAASTVNGEKMKPMIGATQVENVNLGH